MCHIFKRITIILVMASFVLSACGKQGITTATQKPTDVVFTEAAKTFAAQLTQEAASHPKATSTPLPTATSYVAPTQPPTATATPITPEPTFTATPTAKPPKSTNTPVPPTPKPVPCNQAALIKHVNYPEGSQIPVGTVIEKTWQIENTGSCTWSSKYELVNTNGDSLGAASPQEWVWGTVAPHQVVNITIKVRVPNSPDTYISDWKLSDYYGHTFGLTYKDNIYPLRINITAYSAYSENFDFLTEAKKAEWKNATSLVTFGDKKNEAPGVAAYYSDATLENGLVYDRVLGVSPQQITDGMISGLFSKYKVKGGDYFRAQIGFREKCKNGRVLFVLKYFNGVNTVTLKEWKKSCNDGLKMVEVKLSDLRQTEVQFMLVVLADGSPVNDNAVWVYPRIERKT